LAKPHPDAVGSAKALKSQGHYTIWQRVGSYWVIERSYAGHYIRTMWDEIKKSWSTTRPYGVFEKGLDPNMRANPRFKLRELGYEGLYEYGPASIEVSGPAGGYYYATIRFQNQEKDVEGKSTDEVLQKAAGWVDVAPELNPQAGMTAKGRRMERKVKASGSAYAPSAVVYAAAKRRPGTGLVKARWAKEHGYPKPNSAESDAWELHEDIEEGLAQALWVTAYADFIERLREEGYTRKDIEGMGHSVAGGGDDWVDVAPEAPIDAGKAADALAAIYAEANNVEHVTDLLEAAACADEVEPDDDYAKSFGHYLGMMALGHGVGWFDDHAEFPLEVPGIETIFDGEDFDFSTGRMHLNG
jgi:hypothetical protein